MTRNNLVLDYLVAAVLSAVVLAYSPLGLLLTKGYAGLNLRAVVMTLALDVFLLAWIGAILTQGRWRRFFFHLLVWTLPLVLFDALEVLARSVRLAEQILPIADDSVLRGEGRTLDYFRGDARTAPADPGWRLYRPRNADGIVINELGLRTAVPRGKTAGEWRVAISGGSTVWGWRVLDSDTVPENVQRQI